MFFSDSQSFTKFIIEAFPDIVPKLSFSILIDQDNNKKKAVLFFKVALEQSEKENISGFLQKFSDLSEIVLHQVGVIPLTDIFILGTIKQLQPVEYETLLQKIKSERIEFQEVELKRELDKLRKSKMIIRSSEGSFSVTELALSIIPHGNFSTSSDVKRLLELGRRKW